LELETRCLVVQLELDILKSVIQLEMDTHCHVIQLELDVLSRIIQLELDIHLVNRSIKA
jgi:hypothetical protein